jgi:MATE family multidrug resistance protein
MVLPFEKPRRSDIDAMVRLAIPVVVVQVGMMLFGVVDTMVVGRLSSQALASVALGHVAVITISSFGIGVLLGIDPLLNQALGARDRNAFRRSVQRGFILAVALMIPSTLFLLPIGAVLALLGQPAETVPLAAAYSQISIPGLLPFYGWVVLRLAMQAMGRLRPIVATVIAVNLFNLVADWVLVFGAGPIPQLGPIGSAWASTIARTLLFVILLTVDRKDLWPLLRFERESFRWRPLIRTVKLGLPIGFNLQLEIVAFSVIALLMGGLGTVTMAAHQVAINIASLTFMVPLGVSQATAVRVGNAIGAGNGGGARRAASSGLILGTGFMVLTAMLFIGLPVWLARAYTSIEEVVVLTATLIPIAGFFQVFDGIQVVAAGVLRGAGDTRVPLVANILGFWLIGLPTSLVLGFRLGFGPQGLWWGLVAGLVSVAAFLLLRVAFKLRGSIERVNVD